MGKVRITVPMNRVEGDLEVRVEIADGVAVDAWCSGTMYRGFERILEGRGALDGLVLTPRICGICGISHLRAAATALENLAGITPPPDATRIRNLTVMTEHVQSDIRQSFLMFAVDFLNPVYEATPLYGEALARFQPFKGETVRQVIRETKKILEIIAILGGQWPHSPFIVPGGLASQPTGESLLRCRLILEQFRRWYERRILGCELERWLEILDSDDLDGWLEEREEHWKSDLGLLLRLARQHGLDRIGGGHDSFLSYGGFPEPDQEKSKGKNGLFPAGFLLDNEVHALDEKRVTEHVAYSWYVDYKGGKHPGDGETQPYATGAEGDKYSWAKAPRYDGRPAETGPLASMMVAGNPLFQDLVRQNGPNAMARQLARLVRPAYFLPAMQRWLAGVSGDEEFYRSNGEIHDGTGCGLGEAARGGLGHWVTIERGRIKKYQIVTPTAWNASPRDSDGTRGPMEESLVGTPVRDPENPVELSHVVRSFDPCLVCTVHAVGRGKKLGRLRLSMTK